MTDLVTAFGENTLGEGEGLLTGAEMSNLDEEEETTEPLSTATLIEIIQEAIEPESWEGDGVNITEYEEGKILISQATPVHEKIQDLLEMFRKQQKFRFLLRLDLSHHKMMTCSILVWIGKVWMKFL